VYFSCAGCGERYNLEELYPFMSDDVEELLAGIPVNRL
jgi:hypothetical protein